MIRLFLIIVVIVIILWWGKKVVDDAGVIFKISVKNGVPKLRGTLPGRSWLEVKDFLAGLYLPSGSSISGVPDAKRFRLVFSDDISESQKQRIRNFLYFGL